MNLFIFSLVNICLLSSVRVVTSDRNGGMNVCVNDMRASERTCERMYVRVSLRASESVSVRPCVCTVPRHARARTYENKVDLSRPYFCTTLPFFTYLVLI